MLGGRQGHGQSRSAGFKTWFGNPRYGGRETPPAPDSTLSIGLGQTAARTGSDWTHAAAKGKVSAMKARIRDLLHASPFQPFVIRMADGREYRIDDPRG